MERLHLRSQLVDAAGVVDHVRRDGPRRARDLGRQHGFDELRAHALTLRQPLALRPRRSPPAAPARYSPAAPVSASSGMTMIW